MNSGCTCSVTYYPLLYLYTRTHSKKKKNVQVLTGERRREKPCQCRARAVVFTKILFFLFFDRTMAVIPLIIPWRANTNIKKDRCLIHRQIIHYTSQNAATWRLNIHMYWPNLILHWKNEVWCKPVFTSVLQERLLWSYMHPKICPVRLFHFHWSHRCTWLSAGQIQNNFAKVLFKKKKNINNVCTQLPLNKFSAVYSHFHNSWRN